MSVELSGQLQSRFSQVLNQLKFKLDVLGICLGFENAKDKFYYFARAERLLHEGKHSIAHCPQVEQILHKGLYEGQLTDHELDVALDFRVDGHWIEKD